MSHPSSANENDSSSLTKKKQEGWNDAIVLEYEARVEPFTNLFIKDLLAPVLRQESQRSQEPLKLLDVGCGSGGATLYALENGFHVTATDVSEAMVERTRQRAQQRGLSSSLHCVVADGQSLSSNPEIASTKYQYVIAAFSLIFFPDPAQGLSEIYQCLSDQGGRVLLSAWCSADKTPAFQIFQIAFDEIQPASSSENNLKGKPKRITGTPAFLTSLLKDANFEDIEIVGPVSHNVHVSSPEEYYNRFALTSPAIKGYLEEMSPNERQAVKSRVMELATERGGGHEDGSISIPSMAYLAYGTKRSKT